MIPVKRLREGAKLPTFGSQQAAGADLYACLEESVTIQPGQTAITRMPRGLSSTFSAREKLSTYALDAPYTLIYGTGCHEDMEPML